MYFKIAHTLIETIDFAPEEMPEHFLRFRYCADGKAAEVSAETSADVQTEEDRIRYQFAYRENLSPPSDPPRYRTQRLWLYAQDDLETRVLWIPGDTAPYAVYREVKEGENLVEIRSSARKWMKTDTMFVSLLALERQMIKRGGLVLHCSFLDAGGSALLFSGPSGIGKTTQAQLWVREKGARIINGDRALLLPGAHGWTAWGWPVCGSSMDCMAQSRPLGHIVFLDQGDSSRIQTLSMAAAVKRLAAQTTINSWNPAFIGRAWDLLEDLAGQIPICRLICTPDERAVETLEKWKRETENFGILP